MDSGQLIGLIVGIVVVLGIVAVGIFLARRRKVDADRSRAAEMRDQAKAEEFNAREREAEAARAEADAQQAELEAERLRETARGRQEEAGTARSGAEEQFRKADEVDPDLATSDQDASGQAVGTEHTRQPDPSRGPDPGRSGGDGRGMADHGSPGEQRSEADRPRNV